MDVARICRPGPKGSHFTKMPAIDTSQAHPCRGWSLDFPANLTQGHGTIFAAMQSSRMACVVVKKVHALQRHYSRTLCGDLNMPTSLTHHVVWPLVLLLGQAKWARRLSAAAVKPRGVHLAVPSVPAIVGIDSSRSRRPEARFLCSCGDGVWSKDCLVFTFGLGDNNMS